MAEKEPIHRGEYAPILRPDGTIGHRSDACDVIDAIWAGLVPRGKIASGQLIVAAA